MARIKQEWYDETRTDHSHYGIERLFESYLDRPVTIDDELTVFAGGYVQQKRIDEICNLIDGETLVNPLNPSLP